MSVELDLGWSQSYMGLKYHMKDAIIEKNINLNATSCPPIALFSHKYYNDINELHQDKLHDFCFIGSIRSNYQNRKWVINFAKKYFTSNSIFVNTDNDPNWELLGDFDYSNLNYGFCPKNQKNAQSKETQYRKIQENLFYFENMCKSKFVLCPAGDSSWSFRFYEVLMCKSIPIVESWHHTYRTIDESQLNYNYILSSNIEQEVNEHLLYNDLVSENTHIFEKHHMLN